ncbi:Uncharacterized protein Adt_09824 [Abeliophyllum distichum]|uniref:C2H2-type domain-containing protein n=1 Tax=Abeliophyllum distichum TaxID=126358 RepID=A0ABD1UIF6_9LAMI
MGKHDDPIATIKNIGPNNDDENYEKQQIIHHYVILSVNCPSCKKSFNGRAILTDDTTVTTHETGGSNLQHHVGEEANPVHKNRKPETNKKKRNRQEAAAAAAAVQNNNTPPNSAGKRGHAFVSDSEDGLPDAKKSNNVNRHLNFNK